MSEYELTGKVRKLKELRAFAEQIAEEISALEDAIKAEMAAQCIEEMQVDVYKIRWMTVKSSRFDATAFRKAMPTLYDQYTKQTTPLKVQIMHQINFCLFMETYCVLKEK